MPVQEPTETVVPGAGGRDETRIDHPAFGQISISRVSAQPGVNLYGSDHAHGNFLLLEVFTSYLSRSLNRDTHSAQKSVLKLALSETQWAAFVSSPNVGSGVPCTLEFTQLGGYLPTLPARNSLKVSRREVLESLRSTVDKLTTLQKTLERLGPKMPAAVRNELKSEVDQVCQHVASNLPYAVDCFTEHMERATDKGRAEIDAYCLNSLIRAGLAAVGSDLGVGVQSPIDTILPAPEEKS